MLTLISKVKDGVYFQDSTTVKSLCNKFMWCFHQIIVAYGGCRVEYGESRGQIGNMVDIRSLVSLHSDYHYHYS